MPDAEEIRWFKATANELNNLLQVISESSQVLEAFLKGHPDAESYLAILRTGVSRATVVTRAMAERVGGSPVEALPFVRMSVVENVAHDGADRRSESPVLGAMPPIEIHNPTGEGELILIVDDEEFITLLARKVLSEEGYRVVTAKNGLQALDIYRKLRDEIALIILDFAMPVMDGADLFAELQLLNPKVPVVLSSGFAEQDRLRNMLSRGLRGFIPKPYTQAKLLAQVRQTLDAIKVERRGR